MQIFILALNDISQRIIIVLLLLQIFLSVVNIAISLLTLPAEVGNLVVESSALVVTLLALRNQILDVVFVVFYSSLLLFLSYGIISLGLLVLVVQVPDSHFEVGNQAFDVVVISLTDGVHADLVL